MWKSSNYKIINKKPIEPNEEEKEKNTRSRSAKLRTAEKI
jgi:16S rRNA (cytosine1402-N4)-methyltransferase